MKAVTAILYTSNTGFTARYARMLAQASGIPAYDAREKRELPPWGSCVLYLGWLCAGKIKGLAAVGKRYQVRGVCAVGLAPAESGQAVSVPEGNRLGETPFFYLRGGYAPEKLTGIYKVMMYPMTKVVSKAPAETEEQREMLAAFQNGGDWVHEAQIAPVLAWLEQNR